MSSSTRSYINGSWEHRLPHNLNISFAYVEGESLLMGINDIAVSSGSACTSATLEPSYVLKALGMGDDLAHSSIRFGIGRFNTQEEVDYVAGRVIEVVKKLRELSPLYEMAKEGIDLNQGSVDSPLRAKEKTYIMAYSDKVLDHYNNPRNVGSLDKIQPRRRYRHGRRARMRRRDEAAGQGQSETGVIEDAKFKTFGCGSAIASSSLATEMLKGKTVDEALAIKNTDHRERAEPAAGEDSLLGAGRRRHQGGDHRLQEQEADRLEEVGDG